MPPDRKDRQDRGDSEGKCFAFLAMGGPCELRLDGAPRPALERAAQAAIAEVQRIERVFSRYRADSVVARINAAAGSGEPVSIDAETASLLDFAAQLYVLSSGLFDITSGVLRRAWDFRARRLPSPQVIEALLPLVGWPLVEREGRQVSLPRAGMELDFGGIGKEYAADRAAGVLLSAGITQGFVSLAGDIRVLGPRGDGRAWRFGIQHPRENGSTIAAIELTGNALATSGDYERYFIHEGRRLCHILDPRTGWPVQGWQSVSVVAPACVAAGSLCTIALLKSADGSAAALGFLREQRADYLAIDAAGSVHQHGV